MNDGNIEDAEDQDAAGAQSTDFEAYWIKLEDTDPRLEINGGNLWHARRNSEGTTHRLYEGNSISLSFEGRQVRFYGLKSDDMVTANILIDGVFVAENVSCAGVGEFQALLWESGLLEEGIHTVTIISNGDRVEVDFIEYK